MKVTRYGRDISGRFITTWYKRAWDSMKWALRMLAISGTGTSLLLGGYFIGSAQQVFSYNSPETIEIDLTPEKIEKLKVEMLSKIWSGESKYFQPAVGEIWTIYDPPESLAETGACQKRHVKLNWECFSYGPMQWKIGTLMWFYEQVHGEKITELRAMEMANDLKQAQDLAVKCWIEVEGCIWHWSTAKDHKTYFEVVIPLVRELSH